MDPRLPDSGQSDGASPVRKGTRHASGIDGQSARRRLWEWNFATHARWKSFGVEPDAAAAAVARAQGATILGSHIAELRGKFDATFDVVTLSHVIEHLHRPDECLRDCWRMLKSGGYLWIETPNIDSVGYEIYSDSWRGLEPPRHLVLFNPGSLTACVRHAGFTDVKMLPPPNAARMMFTLSASMRAGRAAALEAAPLERHARKALDAQVRRAMQIVNEDPDRAEFIRVIAYKP
jgi:SAM-dependent methyltransferase